MVRKQQIMHAIAYNMMRALILQSAASISRSWDSSAFIKAWWTC